MRLLIFLSAIMPMAVNAQQISTVTSSNVAGSYQDIVITEIMADPDPPNSLPNEEYFEILNRSSVDINLSGWTIFDGSVKNLPSITINTGEYVIICSNSDTSVFAQYGKCAGVSSLSLTNSGEKIAIRDPSGISIDSLNYSDSWYGSSLKVDGGWSLEKVDYNFSCSIAGNWQPTINPAGGTPGFLNSVNGFYIDDDPPFPLNAYCPDSISIQLLFNEPMSAATIIDANNYVTSMGAVPINVAITDMENTSVLLTFTNKFTNGLVYKLYISDISDCSSLPLPQETSIRFGLEDTLTPTNIIINELLFNPWNDGYDFVELYNNGESIINLNKLNICALDPQTSIPVETEKISEDPYLLFPGDYIVISEEPSVVASQYISPFPKGFLKLTNLPSMNVDEGMIAILKGEQILDKVYYNESFHFPLINDVKGVSLEKTDPSLNSLNPGSWNSAAPSAGFATPGQINSQFYHAVVENTVSATPEIFSPDYDGIDDIIYFRINTISTGYISNLWIYNSLGQMIFSNAVNFPLAPNDYLSWNGINDKGERAQIGIYIALVEVFNLNGEVKKYKLPFVLAAKI
jgi:hypothetical protein